MEKTTSSPLVDLDILWKPQDPAASEIMFRNFLPAARQSQDADRSHLIELLTQVARAQGAQAQYNEARATLEEAGKLLEDDASTYRVSAKIRYLLERGRLYVLEKTPAQGRVLFSQAWTLAVNSGDDFFTVDVARMMASIVPQKEQEEWLLRAIQIAEASPQEKARRWLGSLYASLGWKLFDLRQYDNALATMQKSLSHFKAFGSEREVFVARWSAGKILRQMNRLEEALALQKSLLSQLGPSDAPDGRLFEEIAECLQALRQTDEAQMYFERAYKELSSEQWLTDNQPLKLKRLKDLGKVR